jgi:hypothetical protein
METELVLSGVSIFVSAIAIIIAVKTSVKQNRVDLFDRRIECYNHLKTYFYGRSLFASSELKLLGSNVKFNNGFKGDVEELFTKVKMLFSDDVWKGVSEVNEHYKVIHKADSYIGNYISLLGEGDKKSEVIDQIRDYLLRESYDWQIPVSEEEKDEFKQLCDENVIVFNDPIDGMVKYNYYDLKELQSEIYKLAASIEEKMFENIEKESRINN